jgi:hypothetical protein
VKDGRDSVLHPTLEDAVEPPDFSDERCPHCGGKPEFKAIVESLTTGSTVRFFQCKDCDHIHTVERRAAAPEAAAERSGPHPKIKLGNQRT